MTKDSEEIESRYYRYAGKLVIDLMIKKEYEHEWESEVLRRLAGVLAQNKFRAIENYQNSDHPVYTCTKKNSDINKAKEILNRLYDNAQDREVSFEIAIKKVNDAIDNTNVWKIIASVVEKYFKPSNLLNTNIVESEIRRLKLLKIIPSLVERNSKVPAFRGYFPSISMMNKAQKKFYDLLIKKIKKKIYPDVEGNISYLFVYTYQILNIYKRKGFEYVYKSLLELSENYHHEKKYSDYCKKWMCDCLLALEKYHDFINNTQSSDIISSNTHHSCLRCNVNLVIGNDADPIDLLKMSHPKLTKYTLEHLNSFQEHLEIVFSEEADIKGSWLQRILNLNPKKCPHYLFSDTQISMFEAKFPYYCFYAANDYQFLDIIREKIREAENRLRISNRIPQVGEKWISETALYYEIKDAFPETNVIQHGRPSWLGLQHFDVWIPIWKIAIEYHGSQHFEPVDFFGGINGFENTKKRDIRKMELCNENKVKMIVATSENSYEEIIEQIKMAKYDYINHLI